MKMIPEKRIRLFIQQAQINDTDINKIITKALAQAGKDRIGISKDALDILEERVEILLLEELKKAFIIMLAKKQITLTRKCLEVIR